MAVDGKTKIVCLIGHPVEHSLSPAMHNAAFEELGLNYCYVALPVRPEDLPDAVRGIRALNFHGCNVTVPHKQDVIPHLDGIDEEARFIGAVNTVKNDGGLLRGFNTDGRGFMESLREAGIDPSGKVVFIAGAGGAARAVSYYLSEKASRLCLFDIDTGRSRSLRDDLLRLGREVVVAGGIEEAAGADMIINATPLGMKEGDPLPVERGILRREQVVCDLVYRDTPLIRTARELGCRAINGLGMLLWQGALAFRIWTGATPPVDLMRSVLLEGMEGRR